MSNHSQAQAAQQGNRTSDGKYTFGTHAEPAGLALGGEQDRAHTTLQSAARTERDPRTTKRTKAGFIASADIDPAEANIIIHEYDRFVRKWNRKNQDPYEYSEDLPQDALSFRVSAHVSDDGRFEPELHVADGKGREHFVLNLATAPPSLAGGSEAWRLLKEKTKDDERWGAIDSATEAWDSERSRRSHALLADMGWSLSPEPGSKHDWFNVRNQSDESVIQCRLNAFEELVLRSPDGSAYGSDIDMQSAISPSGGKISRDSVALLKESLRLAIRRPAD